jgi:hypothetical protein
MDSTTLRKKKANSAVFIVGALSWRGACSAATRNLVVAELLSPMPSWHFLSADFDRKNIFQSQTEETLQSF